MSDLKDDLKAIPKTLLLRILVFIEDYPTLLFWIIAIIYVLYLMK